MQTLDFRSDPKIGQDRWVVDLFARKRGGFFVEAGACDGVGASNTYVLERSLGWKGICVEPSDEFYARLVANRDCACENVCLSDRRGTVRFRSAGYYGGIEERLSDHHYEDFKHGTVAEKPCVLLEDLLVKHDAPRTIDYLSLDLEGGELAVLKSFPFDRYDVLAMTVEQGHADIAPFLESLGYERVVNPYSDPSVTWELHFVRP